ncbi:MAG: TIGR04086 family membrane protein [Cellulosilyticum sp.]|nr:TIGR04086 family membrane protein [Cellulosilyticum sp.]
MNIGGGVIMAKQSRNVQVDLSLALLTMVKANIMAYVVTAIFILFSSIVLTYTNATPQFENVISILGITVSAFLAGFDTAKVENRNGYKWGAVGGSLYFFIFLILGTVIDRLNHVAPSMICLIAALVLVISSVAGMVSVNCESRSTSRRV